MYEVELQLALSVSGRLLWKTGIEVYDNRNLAPIWTRYDEWSLEFSVIFIKPLWNFFDKFDGILGLFLLSLAPSVLGIQVSKLCL